MAHLHQAYRSMPSLASANAAVTAKTLNILENEIRALFLEHKMQDNYGVTLIHKHFEMAASERLVDYKGASTPWMVGETTQRVIPKYNREISPRTWRHYNGEAVPVEFGLFETGEVEGMPERCVQRVLQSIAELGLEHIFGIRNLTGHDASATVEFTEGRTNMIMPVGSIPEQSLIAAVWIFSDSESDRCHCAGYCVDEGDDGHLFGHGCS